MKSGNESLYRKLIIFFGVIAFILIERDLFVIISEKADTLLYYLISNLIFLSLLVFFKTRDIKFKDDITYLQIDISSIYAFAFASLIIFDLPVIFIIFLLGYAIFAFLSKEKFDLEKYSFEIGELFIVLALSKYIYSLFSNYLIQDAYFILKIAIIAIVFYGIVYIFTCLRVANKMGISFRKIYLDVFNLTFPISLIYLTTGMLVALTFEPIGFFAFAFFLLTFIGHQSFQKLIDNENLYSNLVRLIVESASSKSNTFEHAEKVQFYAINLGREFGILGGDLKNLGYAAIIHDIGKIGVDEFSLDYILESKTTKGGELLHSEIGSEIVENVPYLAPISYVVRTHHKPFSMHKTKAYEKGVIPLMSRIIMVANGYVRLIAVEAEEEETLTPSEAYRKMRKDQGIVYDPKVVRTLHKILEKEGKLHRSKSI